MTDSIAFSFDKQYYKYDDVPSNLKLNWVLGRGNHNVEAVKEPGGVAVFVMPPPDSKIPYAEEFTDYYYQMTEYLEDYFYWKGVGSNNSINSSYPLDSINCYGHVVDNYCRVLGTIPPHDKPYFFSYVIQLYDSSNWNINEFNVFDFQMVINERFLGTYGNTYKIYNHNVGSEFQHYGSLPVLPPDGKAPASYIFDSNINIIGNTFFEETVDMFYYAHVCIEIPPNDEPENITIYNIKTYSLVISEYDASNDEYTIISSLDFMCPEHIMQNIYGDKFRPTDALYAHRTVFDMTLEEMNLFAGYNCNCSLKSTEIDAITLYHSLDDFPPRGKLKRDGQITGDFLQDTILTSDYITRLENEINIDSLLYDVLDPVLDFAELRDALLYDEEENLFSLPFDPTSYAYVIAPIMGDQIVINNGELDIKCNFREFADLYYHKQGRYISIFEYYSASYISKTLMYRMLREIHACLGAGEFSYYEDDNGDLQPYYMNMARTLQRFARAYGVSFKPDGSVLQIRARKNIKFSATGSATIPDGWARGQFVDNTQATSQGGQPSTGITDDNEEERVGIAYQNRCNRYENFDDTDPTNNTYLQGDIVLCENFLQLYESYLEDLDKGLNWQEMGTGILPSADGTGYCTYEGIGTLLAEAVYMISQLSSNIYQTHNLSLQNTAMNHQILKGLGLPLKLGSLEVVVGESDSLGLGDSVKAYIPVPMLADDAVSLHKRLMDVIINLSLIIAGSAEAKEEPPTP